MAPLLVSLTVVPPSASAASPACEDGSRESAKSIADALDSRGPGGSLVTEPVSAEAIPGDRSRVITLRYAATADCAWALVSGSDGDTAWIDRRPIGVEAWDGPLGLRAVPGGSRTTYTGAFGTADAEIRACGRWAATGENVTCTSWFSDSGPTQGANDRGSFVALGDSYSSGEGLAPFERGTSTPTNRCHRSDRAYSQLMSPAPDRFVACSGQLIEAFSTSQQGEPPQRDALHGDESLVTMTFGGNDLGWTDVLVACTKIQDEIAHKTLHDDPDRCSSKLDETSDRIDRMKSGVMSLYEEVLTRSPKAQVRVLTYPPMFPMENRDGGCRIGRLHPVQLVLAADVARRAGTHQQTANSAIVDAVNTVAATSPDFAARIKVVDVETQFGGYLENGHTISCGDTGRPTPWINSAKYSSKDAAIMLADAHGGNLQRLDIDLFNIYSGSFHPTEEGHRQMHLALLKTLS